MAAITKTVSFEASLEKRCERKREGSEKKPINFSDLKNYLFCSLKVLQFSIFTQ